MNKGIKTIQDAIELHKKNMQVIRMNGGYVIARKDEKPDSKGGYNALWFGKSKNAAQAFVLDNV